MVKGPTVAEISLLMYSSKGTFCVREYDRKRGVCTALVQGSLFWWCDFGENTGVGLLCNLRFKPQNR